MEKLIKILSFLKSLNKNTVFFILGALFILLLLGQCNRISSLKQELRQTQEVSDRNFNNYRASKDTITIEKNSNKELVATIRGYEYDINSLTNENKRLIEQYRTALNIKKETEKINSLIKADLQIKDSIINANSFLIQNKDTISFVVTDDKEWDKYNWRRFSGKVSLLKRDTTFSIASSQFNFNQGISLRAAIVDTEQGNKLKITSSYPGLQFTRIENIELVNDELNKPRANKAGWSIGPSIGVGFTLTPGQVVSFGPTIGISAVWSPKWLRF